MFGLGKLFGGIHKAVKKVGGGVHKAVGSAVRGTKLPGTNKGIFKKKEEKPVMAAGEASAARTSGFKKVTEKLHEKASAPKPEAAQEEAVHSPAAKPEMGRASLASRMRSESGNAQKSWQKPAEKKRIAVKNTFNRMTKGA